MAEEAIFSFVLETLRDLVIQETQLLSGVDGQVKRIQQELNRMHWFLRDTSADNQDRRKRILEWVLEVRDIAYEAENVIDTYAIKVASRRRGGIVGNIKRFAGALNECYHRHQIGSDIETLLTKISDLTKSYTEYGIIHIMENKDDGASRPLPFKRTYSMGNDEVFVGSDDSINMLAEKLVSDQYQTITLYGMGGLGKTTLARKVYHHPVVMKHFDGFVWVPISQHWDKDNILRLILTKLMPDHKRDNIQKWRDEELVRELSQLLRTSKCLLVLDDIWSVAPWESIKPAIPVKETGSKLLLTTRHLEVGTNVDAHGYKHQPKILTTDESWQLLCNKALGNQQSQDPTEITKKEKIGKEMIEKCGGLPLAVVALGGILLSKSSDEWKSVCDNVHSYLRKVKHDETNVEAILALSYDDLPFYLKPCFLYMSKYAEDAEIEVVPLYQYWMAEGMVSSEHRMGDDETIMNVAEGYLGELAERSMVFVQKEEEEYPFSRFKSCLLHDLIRNLCISKAKEERFLQSIHNGNIHDVGEASSTRTIHRLSISLDKENDVKRFFPHEAVRRSLRSFSLNLKDDDKRDNKLKFKFSEFVMLRVLSIGGVKTYHRRRASIGKLVHLRYLKLRDNGFSIMSSSISNLKQLQTLDLRDQEVVWKPNVIWKLPLLNHLYLPLDIEEHHFTKKLGFDGMPQLEILEGFNNKVCNVKHLSTLRNLRKLEATVNDKVEELEELINHVRNLTHLRVLDLTIYISDLYTEKGVGIMNDILSYTNLVTLWIWGKFSKFPEYDSGLCPNLRSLVLDECEIEEDPVGTLERLPNLRKLALWRN